MQLLATAFELVARIEHAPHAASGVAQAALAPELIAATIGGLMIGLASAAALLFSGRVVGVSGIVGGLLPPRAGDADWRVTFVAGLIAGGLLLRLLMPEALDLSGLPYDTLTLIAGGVLVGVGTRMANGCTSGHGVCGVSRLAPRSLAATATFMAVAVLVVLLTRHVIGA